MRASFKKLGNHAHLESWASEKLRRRQLDQILADQIGTAADRAPVIIGGDFNNVPVIRSSLFGRRLTDPSFADALSQAAGQHRTSIHHSHPIDWILTKNLDPDGGGIADVAGASDHYPVFVALAHSP